MGRLILDPHGFDLVGAPVQPGEVGVTDVRYPVGDVRRYGAKGDGITNDTAAFNAALAAANGTGVVRGVGSFVVDPVTWPASVASQIRINGTLKPTTTFVVPSTCALIGEGGYTGNQFGIGPCMVIVPPAGNIPTVRVTGSADHLLENIQITAPTGIGIYIDGSSALSALVKLRNVNVNCNQAISTSIPLKTEACFWLWIEGGSFQTVKGAAGSDPTTGAGGCTLWFNNEVTTAQGYSGFVQVRDTILSGHGVRLRTRGVNVNAPFFFKDITHENCLTDFCTIDIAGAGMLADVTIDHCELADRVNSVYMVNVVSGTPKNVQIVNGNSNDPPLNPASLRIDGFSANTKRRFDYSTPVPARVYPAWTPEYELELEPGVRDVRWVGNPWSGGLGTIPGTVLNFPQDPTLWSASTATLTTGVQAPDGSLMAGTVSGANGYVTVGNPILGSVAVGDWFIVGLWSKFTDLSNQPEVALLGMLGDAGFSFNDVPASSAVNPSSGDSQKDDGSWHFIPRAYKVASVGTNATPRLYFRLQRSGKSVTSFAFPFVIQIPAGTLADTEVALLARSLKGAYPNAVAGDLAALPHQKLRLGGGVRLLSATAIPTSGTHAVGDCVKNSAPSVGNPKGWVCTVAGTQGTLAGVTGSITTGTNSLAVNTTAGLAVGQLITIAGVTGTKTIVRITGTTVLLDTTASATVTGAAVAYSAATFVSEGNL